MRSKIQQFLIRLGNRPEKSWARFKAGLCIFCLGAAIILTGPYVHVLLQVPGVMVICIGFVIAMRGYAGIFANRFSRFIQNASRYDQQ